MDNKESPSTRLALHVVNEIFKNGQAALEGNFASKENELKLIELGFDVARNDCPVLFRQKLIVKIKNAKLW